SGRQPPLFQPGQNESVNRILRRLGALERRDRRTHGLLERPQRDFRRILRRFTGPNRPRGRTGENCGGEREQADALISRKHGTCPARAWKRKTPIKSNAWLAARKLRRQCPDQEGAKAWSDPDLRRDKKLRHVRSIPAHRDAHVAGRFHRTTKLL